jgi:putative oxidoreductase
MASIKLSGALRAWAWLTARLRGAGETVPRAVMRLVMGWEFWESGLEKLRGENWFASIQSDFPFPFNVVPADLSWTIATGFELVGAVLLWLGLGTRFVAFSLLVLTFVATAAVHWPDTVAMWSDLLKGYAISDQGYGNYKLPLLFSVMLLPLVFNGAGRLSLDHWLAGRIGLERDPRPVADAAAWALAAAVLGIPFLLLEPLPGTVLLAIAAVSGAVAARSARRT